MPQKDLQLDFAPVEFRKTTFEEVGIKNCDFTRGDDYVVGHLQSVYHAKNALMFSVRFTPGIDANEVGPVNCEVEFLLLNRNGRYVGMINRQAPENLLGFTGGKNWDMLDSLGQDGTNLGGRHAATFFCRAWSSGKHRNIPITVETYIGRNWLGQWRDFVVRLPKKELYIARL